MVNVERHKSDAHFDLPAHASRLLSDCRGAPMDLLMELEDEWTPLEPFGPEDATILSSVSSFLEEIEELPAPLESDAQQLSSGVAASSLLLQPLKDSPPLVPLLPASAKSVLPFNSESPPLLMAQAPASKGKRKRRRPQEEIDELHKQVYGLTLQLDALRFQETHGAQVDPTMLRNMPPSSWRLLQSSRPSYRAMAINQREARRRAEFENMWLCALVKSTSAKGRVRATHRGGGTCVLGVQKKRARTANPLILAPRTVSWDSEPVFGELLAGLDSLYLATDEILAPYHPIPEQLPVQQFNRRKGVFGESFISFVESRVLPFELCVVERALRRALLEQASRVYPNFQRDFSEEINDDTMLTSSRLGVRRGDSDLDIWIHIATRRYFEPSRVVVVSRTHVKLKTTDSGASVGITYRETRIRILKPTGVAGCLVSSTVMQSHLAVYRELTIESPGEGWNDGEDTAFAAHGWRHSILALNQAIENLVLDEAAGRSK